MASNAFVATNTPNHPFPPEAEMGGFLLIEAQPHMLQKKWLKKIMKLLKWLEVAGRVLLAGVLIVGNVIMNVIGLIIGAITSQK